MWSGVSAMELRQCTSAPHFRMKSATSSEGKREEAAGEESSSAKVFARSVEEEDTDRCRRVSPPWVEGDLLRRGSTN